MRLLEQALSHGSHSLFVFSNFLRNAYKHAKFRWQVDILSFLFNFEEWLI